MTTRKGSTVVDDPIATAIEELDAPRRQRTAADAQAAQAAAAALSAPVAALIRAVLAEARTAAQPAEQQLGRPLALGGPARSAHFEPEDLRAFDGVLDSLAVATKRGREIVGALERLAHALEDAGPERIAAIEREARELVPQVDGVRTRTAVALNECQAVAVTLAASAEALRTHVAWLEAAR